MTSRRLVDRRQRRFQRTVFWLAAAVLVGYGLLAGDHKPHHLAVLWLEEQRTDRALAAMRARNEELAAERTRLESDTLAIETLAREKGMIKPGDVVYRIVPVPPGTREAAAESMAVREARALAARAADSLRDAARRPAPVPEIRSEAAAALVAPPSVTADPRWKPFETPRPAAPADST